MRSKLIKIILTALVLQVGFIRPAITPTGVNAMNDVQRPSERVLEIRLSDIHGFHPELVEPVKPSPDKPKKADKPITWQDNPNDCDLDTEWIREDNFECIDQPEQTPPVSQPETPINTSYSGSLQDWLTALRMCESGGDYTINTGNGYFGAYQFSERTWNHWNTGYAYAHLAPPSVQDATIIKNTNAASGGLATQNPGCYKKQGLSQFPPN